MTPRRQLILNLVNASCHHPTADQLYEAARRAVPGISLATVYRNLNALVELKRIRRLAFPGFPDRFDKIQHPHDHLVCTHCGQIVDIDPVERGNVSVPPGVSIEYIDIIIYGRCAQCQHLTP
ncbi:MAG: Fur family transcriptional regulator [Bradymonadia bacterium]